MESENSRGASVSLDIPDGVTQSITKIEDYLKKIFFWGRILLVSILALYLFGILIYNFFGPNEKDVSQKTINTILKVLNAEGLSIDTPPRVDNLTEWEMTPKSN